MTDKEYIDFVQSMYGKTEEEINIMANSGMFNSIIEGYCKIVAKDLGVKEEDIEDYNFYSLFDMVSAEEARLKA